MGVVVVSFVGCPCDTCEDWWGDECKKVVLLGDFFCFGVVLGLFWGCL